MTEKQFWPPQVGDVWLGSLDQAHPITFVCTQPGWLAGPQAVLMDDAVSKRHGPLRLIWRDGQAVTANHVSELDADRMTPQACPAGIHPDWAVDSEDDHECPWCEIDRLRGREADAELRAAALDLSDALYDVPSELGGARVNVRAEAPDGVHFYAGIHQIIAGGSALDPDDANPRPGVLCVGPGTGILFVTDQYISEFGRRSGEAAADRKA